MYDLLWRQLEFSVLEWQNFLPLFFVFVWMPTREWCTCKARDCFVGLAPLLWQLICFFGLHLVKGHADAIRILCMNCACCWIVITLLVSLSSSFLLQANWKTSLHYLILQGSCRVCTMTVHCLENWNLLLNTYSGWMAKINTLSDWRLKRAVTHLYRCRNLKQIHLSASGKLLRNLLNVSVRLLVFSW